MQDSQIIRTEYSELMKKSYIDYAMSVIIARALPDVRDGLKPVQRRTLYDMYELGIRYDKPYRKCARIVGDTMGKYHPHGDSSIYDALVVMAQEFKKGMALVDGHGNFGSIEGDGAAAMRYTEARLAKITQEAYLADLDKNIVDFMPNFDETEKEPEVLPVRVPNLLINGADGIAVGMATSIPPHNLAEVIDAVEAYMKHEDISTKQLMNYIKGPDFPTGGIVVNKDDLLEIYESGTGKIKVRGKVEVEEMKGGKKRLVITEIPYTMIGAGIGKFLNDVCALVETKKTNDIVDISNMSSKEGIRIVIELKKGADVENLTNMLYKKTRLEDTFGVNMLAVADGRPETMGLKKIIEHHVDFQFELATRKYKTLLAKERDRKEIQEGLIKACDVIDLIIEILRGSQSVADARACLTQGITENIKFKSGISRKMAAMLRFTERQANAILEMRLYKLIGLEIEALMKEIIQQQTERRKSELDALQSQINPHFLYNTLESITWMIEAQRNKEAVVMISELAKLLRVSLSRGKTIISIGDELQHSRSYMDIQLVRYKERFKTEFQIDEEIENYCIVKLVIQPILENAIYYGVGDMEEDEDGKITVRGEIVEGDIYISIEDNGMGMREDVLENILTNNDKVPKHGSGVGVINVHSRIRLMFGEKYGLQVYSEPDEGTKVVIHIPAIPYTKENIEQLETQSLKRGREENEKE